MKTFLVTGTIIDPSKMTEEIFNSHKNYTGAWMESGNIVMSGLNEDMSGSVTMVKANSISDVEEFYENEPFFLNGIQKYEIKEMQLHYINKELI